MKEVNEKVKLNAEESKQVSGGLSLSGFSLAQFTEPTLQVYAQVASTLSTFESLADSFSSAQPVSPYR